MPTPAEIVETLHAASRQAEQLAATDAATLSHLAKANFLCLAAMRAAARPALHLASPQPTTAIRPGLPTRWFIARLESESHTQPQTPVDPTTALREFRRSHEAALELLAECRHLDLNKIRFRYPFAPFRFTVGAGFLLINAHERAHLWHHQKQ
jgi:hypothetical protein